MNYELCRYYIFHEEIIKFDSIISQFDQINTRILKRTDGKLYTRVILWLDSVEQTMIKLALDFDRYIVSIEEDYPSVRTAILDSYVETSSDE